MDNMLDMALVNDEDQEGMENIVWNNLPNELLIEIFDYVSHSDLQQIRLVCKHWHNLTLFPKLKKKSKIKITPKNVNSIYECVKTDKELPGRMAYDTLELHNLGLNDELKLVLKSLGPNIRGLRLFKSGVFSGLNDCMPELEELILIRVAFVEYDKTFINLGKLKNFKALSIGSDEISEDIKDYLIVNLIRAKSLRLEKFCVELTKYNEELILRILNRHSKTLKYLSLTLRSEWTKKEKWKEVYSKLRQLENLSITCTSEYEWLKLALENLPKETPLRYIDLGGGLKVDDSFLKIIASKWHDTLEVLGLMLCNRITDDGIKCLGIMRHKLKHLNILNCSGVSCKSLLQGLVSEVNTSLKKLKINNMPDIDGESIKLMSYRLPHLTCLSLENCRAFITDTVLECIFRHQRKLQQLVLEDCAHVTDGGLLGFGENPAPISNLKGLKSLIFAGCWNISDRALEALKFNELHTLTLGYFLKITSKGLEKLRANCPAVENLSFISCPKIDDDAILHISCLPRLRVLSISNCSNITEKSIDYIINFCKYLRVLSLRDIKSSNKEEVKKNIEKLKLNNFSWDI